MTIILQFYTLHLYTCICSLHTCTHYKTLQQSWNCVHMYTCTLVHSTTIMKLFTSVHMYTCTLNSDHETLLWHKVEHFLEEVPWRRYLFRTTKPFIVTGRPKNYPRLCLTLLDPSLFLFIFYFMFSFAVVWI